MIKPAYPKLLQIYRRIYIVTKNIYIVAQKSVLLLLVLLTLTACWERNSQSEDTPSVPAASPISLSGQFVMQKICVATTFLCREPT